MMYREVLPPSLLIHHVECFWEMTISPQEGKHHYEVMAPDCTFDIIFSPSPLSLEFTNHQCCINMNAGGAFVGQKTSSVRFLVQRPHKVVGIRFKPFAFAHLLPFAPTSLTNKSIPLGQLFELRKTDQDLIRQILKTEEFEERTTLCTQLALGILKEDLQVDELFRAQLNYILTRKGLIEIKDLFSTFGISKVTLRKHFLEKMGISPKIVSRIWRLNYFLELKRHAAHDSLTALALESGYYDQAHFIREFRRFFHDSPKRFFQQKSQLLSISQDIISNRFSRRYDPAFVV